MTQPQAIEWQDDFAVGVSAIDTGHRALLDLLNNVRGVDQDARTPAVVCNQGLALLQQLNDYAALQFRAEEALMREHLRTDERVKVHIAAHRSYWSSITFYRQRYQTVGAAVWSELVHYLERWWLQHMLVTNKELGRELSAAGVR